MVKVEWQQAGYMKGVVLYGDISLAVPDRDITNKVITVNTL